MNGTPSGILLREPAFPGVQFNEFRSAVAFSRASHELNQRRRTVAADALAKIFLKGCITVFLTFDGAAKLNDRVGDQSVVGPARCGLFCHDEWEDEYETMEVVDQPEVLGEDGEVVTPAVTHTEQKLVTKAGDRYGIQYEEFLTLECTKLRRELQRIRTTLAANGIAI